MKKIKSIHAFWKDSWDNNSLIPSSPCHDNLKIKLTSLWGDKVKNYKIKICSDGFQQWRWLPVDGLGLDPDSIKAYEKIVSERCIKQSKRFDDLIWVGSKDGKYSVKLCYKALIHSQCWKLVEMPLKLFWDVACLPKAGFFLWLALQNRILTTDRLARFGIIGPLVRIM